MLNITSNIAFAGKRPRDEKNTFWLCPYCIKPLKYSEKLHDDHMKHVRHLLLKPGPNGEPIKENGSNKPVFMPVDGLNFKLEPLGQDEPCFAMARVKTAEEVSGALKILLKCLQKFKEKHIFLTSRFDGRAWTPTKTRMTIAKSSDDHLITQYQWRVLQQDTAPEALARAGLAPFKDASVNLISVCDDCNSYRGETPTIDYLFGRKWVMPDNKDDLTLVINEFREHHRGLLKKRWTTVKIDSKDKLHKVFITSWEKFKTYLEGLFSDQDLNDEDKYLKIYTLVLRRLEKIGPSSIAKPPKGMLKEPNQDALTLERTFALWQHLLHTMQIGMRTVIQYNGKQMAVPMALAYLLQICGFAQPMDGNPLKARPPDKIREAVANIVRWGTQPFTRKANPTLYKPEGLKAFLNPFHDAIPPVVDGILDGLAA